MTDPRRTSLRLGALALLTALVLSACVPISTPFLRNVDGQTWAARFDVAVGTAEAPVLRLPVDLALTFRQSWTDVTADATLEYDAGLFRLNTSGLIELSGRLGLDDHLDLESPSGALTFDGRFVGDRLIGTVAIAGVVPVGDVVFTRIR
ncbi:MAG: hypothetical protein P1P87_11615 [Trueperaceae bacterium]|nr:hypothetical protein [Trueperaceae bacterium]